MNVTAINRTGLVGAAIGTKTFDLASKSIFAFFPGIGNAANAIVSGTITASIAGATTAILGNSIIEIAEDMDKARKNGEKLDRFFKEMEKR